jgi:hypothetical protein
VQISSKMLEQKTETRSVWAEIKATSNLLPACTFRHIHREANIYSSTFVITKGDQKPTMCCHEIQYDGQKFVVRFKSRRL